MDKTLKRVVAVLMVAAIVLLTVSCSAQQTNLHTTPVPQETEKTEPRTEEVSLDIKWQPGDVYSIAQTKRILTVSSGRNARREETIDLALKLYSASGLFPREIKTKTEKSSSTRNGDIVILEDHTIAEDAYRIVITGQNIYIYHNTTDDYNGLLYGLQSVLKQCIRSKDGTLACGEVSDGPETKERTLMLDCARKCWSVQWIKKLIAEMSWMGFNALELHLTEEQGIRANIWKDKNGRIVTDCNGNDFSFICGGTVVSWNTEYAEDVHAEYSRDDLIEVIRFARYHHIDIIPSVDFPGHSKNLIVRCADKLSDGLTFRFNNAIYSASPNEKIAADGSKQNTIDISSLFTRNLSYAILQAYAAFFKEYGCDRFDIASDEVVAHDTTWSEYAKQNGGATMFDGYILYVNSLCEMLKTMGYSVRANNDYLFSAKAGVPIDPDLQVCYWKPSKTDYGSAGFLASEGRKLFNSVESYCYYVLRQSKSGYDARNAKCGWWSFHHATAQRIYSGCGGKCGFASCNEPDGWNPSKMWEYDSLSKNRITGESLAGAYYYIWGDWACWDTENNIFYRQDEYSLIKRMWSSASKMWHWEADKDMPWNEFETYIEQIEYSPILSPKN